MQWFFGGEWNPNVPCHSKCDMKKIPTCSMVITAKQNSKYTNDVFIPLENFRAGCKTTTNQPIMQQAIGVVIS